MMLKKIIGVMSVGAVACFATVAWPHIVSANNTAQQERFVENITDNQSSLQQTSFVNLESTARGLYLLGIGCNDCPTGVSDGAVQGLSKMVAGTFHQPANTRTYIADLMQDMNIAQPAYAQGLGFASLSPLLELWKVMRNIAYLFFVFVFLIIGFAIMFRQKLGGQAAVTVQQALPRIVVALLMVTFSYAIAGLLIDLMYIIMFMLLAVFSHSSLLGPELTNFRHEGSILSRNIFGVFVGIITSNFAGDAGKIIGQLVEDMLSGSGSVGDFVAWAANGIAAVLGGLIILFAIIFAMFKTFFALAKVYFEIILQIAFAPVMLMMGAIQSNVFGNWIKGLAINLAVFPLLLVFIIIGYLLVGGGQDSMFTTNMSDGGFVPPFLPGRGSADTVGLIAGIGAIMLLPEVANIMGRFKPKSVFDDLGKLAMNNLRQGELGIPLVGGAMGAGYGGARVVASPEFAKADWKARRKMLRVGVERPDGKGGSKIIGGIAPKMNVGFGYGQNIRKKLDDAQDGRLWEPDNLRAQLDSIIRAQPKKQDKEEKSPKAKSD